MTAGPYSIGSNKWSGASKLIEEMGEVQQVLGKLIGSNGDINHFDGTNLKDRLELELGDLSAALLFFIEENKLNDHLIEKRCTDKLALFSKWRENNI